MENEDFDDLIYEVAYEVLESNKNWLEYSVFFGISYPKIVIKNRLITPEMFIKWIEDCEKVGYITRTGTAGDSMLRGEWIGLDGE